MHLNDDERADLVLCYTLSDCLHRLFRDAVTTIRV